MNYFKYIIFVFFSFLVFAAPSGHIPWNNVPAAERISVKNLSIRFFDAYNKNEFHKIREILYDNEVSYGGKFWMSIPRFSYLISSLREKGPVRYRKISVASFDDCIAIPFLKKEALRHHPVFDNNCLLATAFISKKQKERKRSTISLVFRKSLKKKSPGLISISGLDPAMDAKQNPDTSYIKKGWRREFIHQLDLELHLPPGFSYRNNQDTIIEYYYEENRKRKSAIQVSAAENDRPLLENSRAWIKNFLRHRRYTTVRIKFLPNEGYRFDFEILDRDAQKNRVIIAALKNDSYSIFITYIGYLELYEKRSRLIDIFFNKLSIEE